MKKKAVIYEKAYKIGIFTILRLIINVSEYSTCRAWNFDVF